MNEDIIKSRIEAPLMAWQNKIPLISRYSRTRGWFYLVSWCHRITGIVLVMFVWFHIYFFSSAYAQGVYDPEKKVPVSFVLALFQWMLSIPMIFHALNGGRLILYESFGNRNDEGMFRWVCGLSIIYLAVLGLLMSMGNQMVSPFFFWLVMLMSAMVLSYGLATKIWKIGHSIFWRLQRISGVFLLIMVPAYFLFMHLTPFTGKETNMVVTGIQRYFIQATYLGILVGALYHGGYGLWSLINDYLSSRILRMGTAFLVTFIMLIFGWIGMGLILAI